MGAKWMVWTVRDNDGKKIFVVKARKSKEIRKKRKKTPMGFDPERFR